jgi:hypothetical protein
VIDRRRITLVARQTQGPRRNWLAGERGKSRIIFIESFTVLRYALEHGIRNMQHDVERVIVDRTATAAQYLEFLSTLPYDFLGDVMFVRDGGAFLSCSGVRGNRVLYQLEEKDVLFYLETNGLVEQTPAPPASALPTARPCAI